MVTYFNKKDVVNFGNWMANRVVSGDKKQSPDGKIYVSDADIENWKEQLKK